MNKSIRRFILSALFFLSDDNRASVSGWLRGRDELKKLSKADYVFVTCPKSGRTWLRIMLSRILQQRYDLPGSSIIGSSSFNRKHPSLPNVFFTHDSYLAAYTGNTESKKDYYGKKILLLVRDPRDIAVSAYFQWKYRMDKQKKAIHNAFFEGKDLTVYEFSVHPEGSLRRTIGLMNSWYKAMPGFDNFMLVHYEELRADPALWLYRIATFLNLEPTNEEIRDAVEFTSIDRMKQMERDESFGSKGRRFSSGEQASNEAYKVRRGKVGGYHDYFSREQIVEIDSLVEDLLEPGYGYTKTGT